MADRKVPRGTSPPGPHVEREAEQVAAPWSDDPDRRTMPAGKVLVVILVALAVWLLLAAPSLKRAAEASEIGRRRSVAIALLTPVSAVSEFLQLDHLRSAVERAAGREPSTGAVEIEQVPLAPEEERAEPPTDVLAPLGRPTTQDPLRLAVVGDSFSQGVGGSMSRAVAHRLVNVQLRGELSTGLTRPDFFNWQGAYAEIEERFRPDVSVVMLGGNDGQTMTFLGSNRQIPLTDAEAWRAAYGDRVNRFMRTATKDGGKLVWVGLPPMRDVNRDHHAKRLNDVYRAEAETVPGVEYLNAYLLFGGNEGEYSPYLRDENGKPQLVRAPDGEHFTPLGYDWVADEILDIMTQDWGLEGDIGR